MNENEHKERREELAPYLLGALEPGEAAALEQHLAGCEECRTELEWLRPAVQVLPETVDPVEPPAELRQRIFEQVGAEAARGPARIGLGRRLRSLGMRPLAGLAVLALLVALVGGYAIRDGSSGPEATTVSAGQAPGVTAQMVSEGDSGTLHLDHVHELPEGRVLQAWVQRGKTVESAKTLFVPNRDGTATAAIDDVEGVDVVMVTEEPRGGSEFPTGEPIVAVQLPS